jgi:menaquinone-specific isochorismate synthase
MSAPRTSVRPDSSFHREGIEVPHADPVTFLAALAGEPRGFWGRQDRWVAWGGAFARIEAPSGSKSRFEEVRDEARRTLRRIYTDWRSLPFRERPRFFGGFSFLDVAGMDPIWAGFPSASFILPRLILESRDGAVRLLVSGVAPGGMRGRDPETDRLAALALEALTSRSPALGRQGRAGPGSAEPRAASGAPLLEEDPAARERWRGSVEAVLEAVGDGRVRKAVLARVVDAAFHQPVDPLASLRFLRAENPRAHVYMIEPHPDRIFLGAAPEILAELRRGRFTATAVAGSMPRGRTDEEDLELAQRLLDSAKDRAEHDLTSEEMAEVLAPRLEDMQVEKEPRVLSLARIQHLETAISGRAKEGEDILSLVQALHPTPAVCGSPREEARTLIRSTETFDRGWYAGPVGWFDLAGEGDFVPALRAAIGAGRRWRLFAGAGIVAGSNPDEEWAETALKFEPALRALDFGAGE